MSSQRIDFENLDDRLQQSKRREEKFSEFRANVFWFFAGALVSAPFNVLLEPIALVDGKIRYGSVVILENENPVIYAGGVIGAIAAVSIIGFYSYKKYIDYDKNPTVKLRLPEESHPVFNQIKEILKEESKNLGLTYEENPLLMKVVDPNKSGSGYVSDSDKVVVEVRCDDSIGILYLTYNQRDKRYDQLISSVREEFETDNSG